MWNNKARRLLRILSNEGLKIAVAESCTCGWLAHMFGSVPGCSQAFWGGIVSYSNHSKRSILNVEDEVMERFGAVSPVVAKSMAWGARLVSNADWTIALTGIAGPNGGSPEKPVGTVHIAICSPVGLIINREFRFKGNRQRVRRLACCMAIKLLIQDIATS